MEGSHSRFGQRPVINHGLQLLLGAVFLLTGLMLINSVYLVSVALAEHLLQIDLQNSAYLLMFLAHLALGLLLSVPLVAFGLLHYRRARQHPNRYARLAGLTLYFSALAVIVTGLLLTRFPFFEIDDPQIRTPAYWLHVLTPLAAIWLFIVHRMAGRPIRWRRGLVWTAVSLLLTGLLIAPGLWSANKETTTTTFEPSLAQFKGTHPLEPRSLMMDDYCARCHQQIANQTHASMHRLSSFNNPAYRASIDDTRRLLLARDGDTRQSRLCAACHDQVPLFSGHFDDPSFDPDQDTGANAGITCLGCHAIEAVSSPKGNGSYVLAEPQFYPFTFSKNPVLQAINHQLIRAKPEFHRKTLMKPVMKTAEFCSVCHKVHLPRSLNHYRWLRAQDHYDSFLFSGVSGHRVDSYYYPPKAVKNCASCHMPLKPSQDPAARQRDGQAQPTIHHHGFLAANTAVPAMLQLEHPQQSARQQFMRQAARVDLFALRDGATAEAPLTAPLGPKTLTLQPGHRYLLEVVVRTTRIGHQLTQGTADSNELWLELTARGNDKILAMSGALDREKAVDPWAYFLNAYLLDRNGQRITRRNAQDIFVTLYNHQIPPGAASVVRYRLDVPDDLKTPLTLDIKLNYRKFDSRFLKFVEQARYDGNHLPITVLAHDRITLPVAGAPAPDAIRLSRIPNWERWNDYGIGLLRNISSGAKKGDLRQAEQAFRRVERENPAQGALNLARTYFAEGQLQQAWQALDRAERHGGYPWTIAWYRAQIDQQQGRLASAAQRLITLLNTDFPQARQRQFDFSKDIRAINLLGQIYYEQALQLRRSRDRQAYRRLLKQAEETFFKTLKIDPENAAAHFNLAQLYTLTGEKEKARHHRALHQKYHPDDQAIAQAVAIHRQRHPAADHAADAGSIYTLEPASSAINF